LVKFWGRKPGWKGTESFKEKMRQVRLGKKHSEETKKKIGRGVHLAYLRWKKENHK